MGIASDGLMPRSFGEALRTAREQAGVNQVELARRMKLSEKSGQSNIASLENRQFPPKRRTALRLAQALAIDVADLLEDVVTPWGLVLRRPSAHYGHTDPKARAPSDRRPVKRARTG